MLSRPNAPAIANWNCSRKVTETLSIDEYHREVGVGSQSREPARTRVYHEDALQEAIVTAITAWRLEGRVRHQMMFWHIPNERSIASQRVRLYRMGVLPGVADLEFLWFDEIAGRPHTAFIEVKTESGRLTDKQQAFKDQCDAMRVPYVVCRSVEDVEETLVEWGLLR